jgi:hypothetical protein
MTGASESPHVRAEVELDIFSGMPNPTWILSADESEDFERQLAALPRIPAATLSGRLGYRGMIVLVTGDTERRSVRVHAGAVQISVGATTVHARDEERRLERWLIETGRSRVDPKLLQIAERDAR